MSSAMRIIEGVAAGREHIARLRAMSKPSAPALWDRLREIFGRDISPQEAVAQIVADVRRDGDAALRDYARRIDGVTLDTFVADAEAIEAAYQSTPAELREALHMAAERIRAFHEREPRRSWLEQDDEGGVLGQLLRPIQRVGVYVPGGRAAYPSSLLMAVIPAQVAGVEEIVVTTPPGSGGTGSPVTLAAARVVGLERVFLLGGAQAVAALAYGTESVPRVDKIVGAGGLFVTLAKKLVYGDVGIDGLYGPTETLIIADETANPALAAADLLAQAEHDPLATPLLITTSPRLAQAVQAEVERQLLSLERAEIITAALRGQGAIIIVADTEEALALANEFAPEHLCLSVADPWPLVERVRNAGGIFVGEGVSEALGDYIVGPSHVMPTGGTARFASPLHVRDFLKVTSLFAPGDTTVQRLAPAAEALARAEGLTAHAAAIEARMTHPHRTLSQSRRDGNVARSARVQRQTKETEVEIGLTLDGRGRYQGATGLGFLDHMLAQFALHGLFDLEVRARGDLEVDEHHTVEDVAIALGQALDRALGERRGIVRIGHACAPMDEALALVVVDLSGRPYAVIEIGFSSPRLGGMDSDLIIHFLETLAVHGRMSLHARLLYGRNDHHKAEALFKALGRALEVATRLDPRRDDVPSTKGVL